MMNCIYFKVSNLEEQKKLNNKYFNIKDQINHRIMICIIIKSKIIIT